MKKTQYIELFKNIKTTFVSFFSIFMFVCLGVGIFTGISWTSGSILGSVDNLVDSTNFHDGEALYAYGFDEEDVNSIRQLDGNYEAYGTHSTYEFFNIDDIKYQAVVFELPNNIDTFIEVKGVLPSKADEIGLEEHFAEKHNIKIGDYIEFDDNYSNLAALNVLLDADIDNTEIDSIDTNNKQQFLKNRKYKITCLLKSPKFTAYDEQCYGVSPISQISINTFMYVNKVAFNDEAYCGYTSILIKDHSLDNLKTFTDEYDAAASIFSSTIDNKIAALANNKNTKIKDKINTIKSTAETKINDAQSEIDDARAEISKNKTKLANGKVELDDALNTLTNATSELNSGKKEYESALGQFEQAKITYQEYLDLYNTYASDLTGLVNYLENNGIFDKLRQIVKDKLGNVGLAAVNVIIEEVKTAPATYISQLNDYIDNLINDYSNQLDSAKRDIQAAEGKIYEGYLEYYDGLNEYNDGLRQISQAEKKLDDANKQLNEAKDKYDDLLAELDKFEDGKYSVTYRKQHAGIIVDRNISRMYEKLRFSMAALFVIVGLLVCYSAISRIVNDQAKMIGTKKALGISEREVTMYYLTYTGIAVILGCVIGGTLGYFLVENIFLNVLKQNFSNPASNYFSIKEFVLISLVEAALLLTTTYVACKKMLQRNAILLLKGENDSYAKQRFYEKLPVWNKLSLLSKTIVNNFFNDSRRVFGTLIGIAGSTALIVTAITFNTNFLTGFDYQFKNVFDFKYVITYDADSDAENNIRKVLEENSIRNTPIYKTRMFMIGEDGNYISTHFFVINDEDSFKDLVKFNPYNSKGSELYKGIWLGSAYSNYFNAYPGAKVKYIDFSGNEYDTTISGYYDHYLTIQYSMVDAKTYKDIFNGENISNSFLINVDNVDVDALKAKLSNIDGFISLEDLYSVAKSSFDVFDQLSSVMVMVYISLSVVMAFLVLLNLLSMFVDEKKTDLIVLMINGFSIADARRYIYSDTIVMSVIGIILGIFLGTAVGNYSVSAFETSGTIVMKKFVPKAALIGTLGSIVLTFIVSVISLRKISKFKLTDINKA